MRRADTIFGLIGLGLSLWLYLESTRFNYMLEFTPGPGFFPFWTAVVLAILSCWLLVDTARREPSADDTKKLLPPRRALYRVAFICLMLLGVTVLMPLLGFPLTVSLFVAAILFSLERYSLLKSAGYGAAYAAVAWTIFQHFMEMGLPKGFLGM
jgi:putative tricarboxylic transport membrane protein